MKRLVPALLLAWRLVDRALANHGRGTDAAEAVVRLAERFHRDPSGAGG